MRNEGLAHPLFYRKKSNANGETDEIVLGPSAVGALRWAIVPLLAIILILGGFKGSWVVHFLLRVIP
jgi:hypothetical protein